jgi:hypothetical protein
MALAARSITIILVKRVDWQENKTSGWSVHRNSRANMQGGSSPGFSHFDPLALFDFETMICIPQYSSSRRTCSERNKKGKNSERDPLEHESCILGRTETGIYVVSENIQYLKIGKQAHV